MDIKEIQNLIKFVAKLGVTEVAIEQGEFKITIKSDQIGEKVLVQQAALTTATPELPTAVRQVGQVAAERVSISDGVPAQESEDGLIEIKSPMIGTFYRKSDPEKPSFVNVGDTIKPGDVLCIIEAMKLFNEIESEVTGKIVKVLVDDTTPIEYDQPLFLVDPS